MGELLYMTYTRIPRISLRLIGWMSAKEFTKRTIEALLCRGRARIDPDLQCDAWPLLLPYFDAGLCDGDGADLVILPEGLPYARSIAAHFDPYRKDSLRRFSSAV